MSDTNQPNPKLNPLNIPPKKSTDQIKKGAEDISTGIKKFFSELIDLREGLDRYGTVKRIKENKRMQGANAWTLMCSIMIASLGLDLNSPAVIIGAMLISPLMSPILGIGLAVGINDRETLWISIRHFLIAIGIAIVTSTFYFFVTPFGTPTPEILARTQPTLLDVLVAFFGGLAGIISGTRKDISNAIPGVAIATALMPPLCVTGFGLAKMIKTGSLTFQDYSLVMITSNSFYLFFLNASFVAFATYLIIRMLRFPYKDHASPKEKRRNQVFVFFVGLLLIIPSFYILNNVLSDNTGKAKIHSFVQEQFSETTICKVAKQIDKDTFEVTVQLFKEIDEASKQKYIHELRSIVPNSNLTIKYLDFLDMNDVNASVEEKIIAMSAAQQANITEKDERIKRLESELGLIKSKKRLETNIPEEVKILFPALEQVNFYITDSTNTAANIPLMLIEWKDKKPHKREEKRLIEFIKYRAGLDTITIAVK